MYGREIAEGIYGAFLIAVVIAFVMGAAMGVVVWKAIAWLLVHVHMSVA